MVQGARSAPRLQSLPQKRRHLERGVHSGVNPNRQTHVPRQLHSEPAVKDPVFHGEAETLGHRGTKLLKRDDNDKLSNHQTQTATIMVQPLHAKRGS